VDIEISSDLTRGMTLVDIYGVTGKMPNADVALELDNGRFIKMMSTAIAELNRKLG
jgi:inosine-uridine nucleoside N-ribohydrolase